MDEAEAVMTFNAVVFLVFTLLLFAGAVRTFARLVYYARSNVPRPRLLNRDAVMIGGFALSFGAILFVRALGLGPVVRDSLAWAVFTAVPALIAVAVYAAYEWFVIERVDH